MPWLIVLGALGLVTLTAAVVARFFGRAVEVITHPVVWTPQRWYAVHITPAAMLPADRAAWSDVPGQTAQLQKLGFASIVEHAGGGYPWASHFTAQFIASVTKTVLNNPGMWIEEVKAPPDALALPPVAVATASPAPAAASVAVPPAAAAGDAWGR